VDSFVPNLKKFAARMAFAVALTTVLSIVGITMVNAMINSRFDNLQRMDVALSDDTGSSQPANFLLIGSDTRAFVDNAEDEEKFVDESVETGQRSDTMMIVHVDPKLKKTIVLSIPRDTRVDIPGVGTKKINASFNTDLGGGPDKVVETIESNFDIPIHHYVEIDFESFQQIVDALGTVNVYFPAPARDSNNGKNESGLDTQGKSGCLPLNGDQALSYVRSRYYQQYIDGRWQSDPTSNFGRIARQQEFMRRVASLAVKRSLTDPLTGRDVADAIIKKLVVDQNLKKDDIFKLMNAFKGVDPNDPKHVQFEMLPVESEKIDGQWFDIVQEEEAEPILEQMRRFSDAPQEEEVLTLPEPNTVTVSVLNGSGAKGLAASTMTKLEAEGFIAGPTGNASSLSTTEINYTKANKAKAQLVATYISGKLVEVSSIADADVVVRLGSEFNGVSTGGKIDTTQTTSVPNTTTAATSKNGVVENVDCPA
jgi:LCP family protein required for cell wall assembly